MSGADWLALFLQCCALSLLTIGGYATVLPDLHRQLVVERGWLGDAAFAQGVALGQVVPGPNILVVGVQGYLGAGWMGLTTCLAGILLPSSLLVWRASRPKACDQPGALMKSLTTKTSERRRSVRSAVPIRSASAVAAPGTVSRRRVRMRVSRFSTCSRVLAGSSMASTRWPHTSIAPA